MNSRIITNRERRRIAERRSHVRVLQGAATVHYRNRRVRYTSLRYRKHVWSFEKFQDCVARIDAITNNPLLHSDLLRSLRETWQGVENSQPQRGGSYPYHTTIRFE